MMSPSTSVWVLGINVSLVLDPDTGLTHKFFINAWSDGFYPVAADIPKKRLHFANGKC